MKRLLAISGVVLLLLGGCGSHISKDQIDAAEALCVKNGGLQYVLTNNQDDIFRTTCKDSAVFYVNITKKVSR